MMFTSIVVSKFDFSMMQKIDYILIIYVFVTTNLYAIMFAFINNNIEQENVTYEKKINEWKQYHNMFNCLQEGILVLKDVFDNSEEEMLNENKQQIFFMNDIGTRIFQKVFKTKKFLKGDRLIEGQTVNQHKIFYEYKGAQSSS